MKRTSTKSFQIELGTKYDTNDAKGKFGRRVQICDVGSISAGGSKSAVKPVRHWLRSNEEIMRHHTLNERMLIITNSDQL